MSRRNRHFGHAPFSTPRLANRLQQIDFKLPGMANHFYRERVDQHLRIGMRAIELMRERGLDQLHSRKLRSFAEVAFQ